MREPRTPRKPKRPSTKGQRFRYAGDVFAEQDAEDAGLRWDIFMTYDKLSLNDMRKLYKYAQKLAEAHKK